MFGRFFFFQFYFTVPAKGVPVDPQEHQGGLPVTVNTGPDVGVPVLGARDDPVRLGCPVDARHELVVLRQLVAMKKKRSRGK